MSALTSSVIRRWVTVIVAVAIVLVLVGLSVVGVRKLNEAAARIRMINNFRMIGMSMLNYKSAYGHLPLPAARPPDDRSGLSWRLMIYPYVESETDYRRFKHDEPWDSPANRQVWEGIWVPRPYAPVEASRESRDSTMRVFVGGGSVFEWDRPTYLKRPNVEQGVFISDNHAETILIVEATEPVLWVKPQELDYSPAEPLPELGHPTRNVFIAAMADGSVRPVRKTIDESVLRALITRSGGERLPPDW